MEEFLKAAEYHDNPSSRSTITHTGENIFWYSLFKCKYLFSFMLLFVNLFVLFFIHHFVLFFIHLLVLLIIESSFCVISSSSLYFIFCSSFILFVLHA